ncbi:uncharacterized protein LOC136065444 [Quercus suber]|uniref:uncharacterized protein LOC111994314 n=1 Tax=Quercus suber TaxID=58331 RepID=UPI000CE1BF1B|nr:uncharacterized protein LOC111994314 [Quercus suber]
MTRMFRDKIGRTIEVYIDDMVVKSKQVAQHMEDLQEVFGVLQWHKLCLNAEKCAFGVGAGKFLRYLITNRGIEVNPDQIEAKWTGFRWSEECDKAFVDLKDYLARAPMLTAPEPGENLFMYLAISEHAVSAMLLRDKGIQQPVYYISKTLVDAETRYLPLEKLVLALIHATRKLPHYFQAHTVQGSFEARDSRMKAYLEQVKQAITNFSMLMVFQVAQTQNRHADSLATLASSVAEEIPRLIKVELVSKPSVKVSNGSGTAEIDVTAVITFGPCWMDLIIYFLAEDRLPGDENEGSKIRKMAPRYWLSEDQTLYRRSFGGPYLLCLHPQKVGELLAELHDGVCGSHVGGRSLHTGQ